MKNKLDVTVIEKAIEGEESAFSTLYETYYNRVYFMAFYYFRDVELASDIVQETFVKVYKGLPKLRSAKAFHSWIMKITYFECINNVRKNGKKDSNTIVTDEIEIFEDDKIVLTEHQILDEEMRMIIEKTLDTMNIHFKTVGYLRYFEEFSLQEIATILEIPVGTVKSRLNQVKKTLMLSLEKEGYTPQSYRNSTIPSLIFSTLKITSENIQLPVTLANTIYQTVTVGGTATGMIGVWSSTHIVTKVLLCIGLGVGTTIVLSNDEEETMSTISIQPTLVYNFENNEEPLEEDIEETMPLAKITAVEYTKQFTNQPIQVEVIIEDGAYDYYTINGKKTNIIHTNGNYTIELYHGSYVIDSQHIEVTNVDTKKPEYVHTESTEALYTLFFKDLESGIDFEKTSIYIDGEPFFDFTYNDHQQSLQIKIEPKRYYEVYVYDYANNAKRIEIQPEKTELVEHILPLLSQV